MNAFTRVGRQKGVEERTPSDVVVEKSGDVIDGGEPGSAAPRESH